MVKVTVWKRALTNLSCKHRSCISAHKFKLNVTSETLEAKIQAASLIPFNLRDGGAAQINTC